MPNPMIDLTQLAQISFGGLLLIILVAWCVITIVLMFMER